jgi:hypothetical protein
MKRHFFKMVYSLIFALALAPVASGEVPEIISYQGVLTDANGSPLNGSYDITVNIYDQALGATPLWGETHTGVSVSKGVFNVMLGKVNPFPVGLDFSVPYWLGIAINGGSELAPRLEFASVGTAFMSKSVVDGSITDAKIASKQVVKSINGLNDNVTVSAGDNIEISNSGNEISISAPDTKISCGWSGWEKSNNGKNCAACENSSTVWELYCSNGVVTQVRTATICLSCIVH